MSSPFGYSEPFTGVSRMDALTKSQDRCRPRASVPYSLSAVLFLPGPIPFVNEEDFRSPLATTKTFVAKILSSQRIVHQLKTSIFDTFLT
jgi:hypothetical protein